MFNAIKNLVQNERNTGKNTIVKYINKLHCVNNDIIMLQFLFIM